jgi:Ni2+-binding GTPase involved in maturation of urease and hydrogenase
MNAPTISKLNSEMNDLEILLLSEVGFNFLRVKVVPEVARIQIIEFDVITNANKDRFVSPKLLL